MFTNLFEPMLVMADEGGPMKTIPSDASSSANFEFSLKNPYLHFESRGMPTNLLLGERLARDGLPASKKM